MSYAPVVLFVYNRPDHTKKTVDALKLNKGASQADLIVYSDAAKIPDHESMVAKTREYVDQITGFRSVIIRKRQENWGLAASIIDGVTNVVEEYGRVIVLEDDILTSPAFLSFMNQALDFYEDKKKVWHISGWSYPINPSGLGDVFLWRAMNCWGWATWEDRWQYFQKEPERLISEWTNEKKKKFDLDGVGGFWSQVEANITGDMNTWAIFWYATIFENGGLCLNPTKTYVQNIGHDGSGQNCGNSRQKRNSLNQQCEILMETDLEESRNALNRVKSYCAGSFFSRFKKRVKKYVFR